MSVLSEPLPTRCPECGCTVIVHESVELDYNAREIRTHCNGQRWEKRIFLCGGSYDWVPNFERYEQKAFCQQTEEYRQKAKEITQIEQKIREHESAASELRQQVRAMHCPTGTKL